MTIAIDLTRKFDEKRVQRQLLERIDGCRTPNCWLIKEPIESNQIIWLRNKELYGRKKGQLVLVKRLVYCMEYGETPLGKKIKNYCGVKNCVNPAHCYIPGIKRDASKVHSQIDVGILDSEDAHAWGLFDSKEIEETKKMIADGENGGE